MSREECEQTRVWAALAPDGELSELERRSLRSHLRVCASCARFAREVEALALVIRSEELVLQSSSTVVTRVPRRRHSLVARARPVAAVAAAAVVLMALGVAFRAPLPVEKRDSGVRTTTSVVAPERLEVQSLRVLRQGARLVADQAPLDRLASPGANEPT